MRAIHYCLILVALVFLAGTTRAEAHTHLLHDAHVAERDVAHGLHDAHVAERGAAKVMQGAEGFDHETAKLMHDAERDAGLLPSLHVGRADHLGEGDSHSELSKAEELLHDGEKLVKDEKKAECKRLDAEFLLRHPPGTKPEGLKGEHGCHLWKDDAHYHDRHPDMISVLGANVYVGLQGAHIGF